MEKNVRLRVLYVMELFVEQTDSEKGVTMLRRYSCPEGVRTGYPVYPV